MEERISFGSGFVKFAVEAIAIVLLFTNENEHGYMELCAIASIIAVIVSSIYYFVGEDDNPAWGRMILALLLFAGVTFLLPAALIVGIAIAVIWWGGTTRVVLVVAGAYDNLNFS